MLGKILEFGRSMKTIFFKGKINLKAFEIFF
jgi:hypothetical protein